METPRLAWGPTFGGGNRRPKMFRYSLIACGDASPRALPGSTWPSPPNQYNRFTESGAEAGEIDMESIKPGVVPMKY